jgi:hypothetical protein
MFSEEFDFVSKKAHKFLPFQKSNKEFDLELGYTRFAFLKAMDRHKEQQRILETTLTPSLPGRPAQATIMQPAAILDFC